MEEKGRDQEITTSFEDYDHIEFLQAGGWGKVYSAIHKISQKKVALKFFGYTSKRPSLEAIEREIERMREMKGIEGVIQLLGVFYDSLEGFLEGKNPICCKRIKGSKEKNKGYPVIVMEYLEIDIFTFISTTTEKMSEEYLVKIFKSIVIALNEIHSRGYIHRDLKLENIMLVTNDVSSAAKIIDLGEMIKLSPGQSEYVMKYRPPGSLGYFAPETVLQNSNSPATDFFQAGCILYSMLSGTSPFHSNLTHSVEGSYHPMIGEPWENISSEGKDLVDLLLQKEPSKRLCGEAILSHPWFAEGREFSNRLGAAYLSRIHHLILRQKMKKFFLSSTELIHEQRIRQEQNQTNQTIFQSTAPRTPRSVHRSSSAHRHDTADKSDEISKGLSSVHVQSNESDIPIDSEHLHVSVSAESVSEDPLDLAKDRSTPVQISFDSNQPMSPFFEELSRKSLVFKLTDLKKRILRTMSKPVVRTYPISSLSEEDESGSQLSRGMSVNSYLSQLSQQKHVNYQQYCEIMNRIDLSELANEIVFKIFDIHNQHTISLKDFILTLITIIDSVISSSKSLYSPRSPFTGSNSSHCSVTGHHSLPTPHTNHQPFHHDHLPHHDPCDAEMYFNLFDVDGNGIIEKHELQTILYLLMDDFSIDEHTQHKSNKSIERERQSERQSEEIDELYRAIGNENEQINFEDFKLFYEAVISSTKDTIGRGVAGTERGGVKNALEILSSRKENNSNSNSQSQPLPELIFEPEEEKMKQFDCEPKESSHVDIAISAVSQETPNQPSPVPMISAKKTRKRKSKDIMNLGEETHASEGRVTRSSRKKK